MVSDTVNHLLASLNKSADFNLPDQLSSDSIRAQLSIGELPVLLFSRSGTPDKFALMIRARNEHWDPLSVGKIFVPKLFDYPILLAACQQKVS
ncbi:MAG: hypothetical protein KJN95_00555, partial [Gammaproteobacteria bacterium]|nr:hypothetical protein [Gammaproteobacteria bacterium]